MVSVVRLLFLTLVSPIGILYIFLGKMRNDYFLVVGGMLLAVYPFFFSDPRVMGVLGAVLALAPFALRKLVDRLRGKVPGKKTEEKGGIPGER
ncbi:MAG: hypothetical protein ACYC5N_04880 [Endomicrobiales bacterium]